MRFRLLVLVSLGLGAAVGCCTPAGHQSSYQGQPLPPGRCDRCAAPVPLPPPAGPPALPANPVPAVPPPQSNFQPPAAVEAPFARLNPDNGGRLFPPLPVDPVPYETPSAKLLPPQSIPSPKPNEPPPAARETEEPPGLPADIPQYALIKKGVASGQQPFPEGVKWLKEHGYKTVLHVRAPTETDNAAKRIFESRGLTYLTLEVGPQALTKDVVERFNQVVADEKNHPLFVFDRNSALAGALWYLHFRTALGMDDEKARAEASRLGFKQEQDDAHRDMWLAVQSYLKNNP